MQDFLFKIATKLWPELANTSQQRRLVGVGEVITFLYSAPLALAGLIWLVFVTDLQVIRQDWLFFVFLALLMFIFRRLGYFMITEIRSGRYASSDGSLEGMALWTGVFLFGPSALWMAVIWSLLDFLWRWHTLLTQTDRWSRARNLTFYLATTNLATLIALQFYRLFGGQIPLRVLSPGAILTALGALLIHFLLVMLIWAGYFAYSIWIQKILTGSRSVGPIVRFLLLALGLPNLSHPFAILAAGLYGQYGLGTFLFFIAGLLMVALLTRQLSWAAETSRQNSRQLEKLEQLGRALLNAPPDASKLQEILDECLPFMFPSGRLAVWIQDDRLYYRHPEDWSFDFEPAWTWMKDHTEATYYRVNDPIPWHQQPAAHNATILAPIRNVDTGVPMGGIYLELFSLAQPWDARSLAGVFPAVHSLAAQVASALNQAQIYHQALAYQQVSQELSLAGKIQGSFLPTELPRMDGWQFAVTLLPARQMSGDYFDLIPLSNDRLGILIADVTDKGLGAALYMALSRTLIRTFAIEFDDDQPQPELVLFSANERILADAHAELFVTAFYGILDLKSGLLTYSNAGHNPPYLVGGEETCTVQALGQTGKPLGIEEETLWKPATANINPGDVLVLYTDGIPDALNNQGDSFQEASLLEAIYNSAKLPAQEIQQKILDKIQDFVGDEPQFDDITLMVLERDL